MTYGTCMAKNKKASMFRTRDSNDSRNPIWDVPGDVLVFRIFDKDHSGMMSFMSSEVQVAQCEIRSDDYYPSGYRANLPLYNSHGVPLPGATLQVEVMVY